VTGQSSTGRRRLPPNHKSSRPRRQGRAERPPGRRQIDLEKTVGAQAVFAGNPAMDILRRSAPDAMLKRALRPTSERTVTPDDQRPRPLDRKAAIREQLLKQFGDQSSTQTFHAGVNQQIVDLAQQRSVADVHHNHSASRLGRAFTAVEMSPHQHKPLSNHNRIKSSSSVAATTLIPFCSVTTVALDRE